jgi:2-polyprenyl-3-methyl-5-hydroxy-6-metoxy-1,4-benzoquinol methylase
LPIHLAAIVNESTPRTLDDALLDAYEEVPYVGRPNRMSHPDRMATIATLLGMNPAPPASCRVLEVACGDGANLIPMAASLPDSRFIGFDFAPSGIARAQRLANELGLTNIEFRTLDLRAFPMDYGEFDYIIAHGLYSWVPSTIRAHLLPLIASHLESNGVAFVSYNIFPGCHIRRMFWEMLKYHARDVTDRRAKLVVARSLISLLSDPASTHKDSDALLRQELQNMAALTDSALAHDDLSEPNEPVYFHEFAAELERNHLTFLAEAELHSMVGLGVTPRVRLALGSMDRLTREQYLDFVHLRRYRQSLVCREAVLSRFVVDPARAKPMHALASIHLLRLKKEGNLEAPGDDADVRALKELLVDRWPRSVPVAELAIWHANRAQSGAGSAAPRNAVETLVVQTYGAGLIELHVQPPVVAAQAGQHPTAFAPARWQARDSEEITNVYHEIVRLNGSSQRQLLMLLDGTRTREQLVAGANARLGGADRASLLQNDLDQFARLGLLVA